MSTDSSVISGSANLGPMVRDGLGTLSDAAATALKGLAILAAAGLWALVWGAPTVLNLQRGRYADSAIAAVVLLLPVVAGTVWVARNWR